MCEGERVCVRGECVCCERERELWVVRGERECGCGGESVFVCE